MNIFQRMSEITNELTAVAKNLQVGEGRSSYKAVGEADVLAAVRPLEHKYGVYSYPVDREIVESRVLTSTSTYQGNTKETQKLMMRIKTTYRFVNIDKPEEYIDHVAYGDGVDPQDKAPGKAMTYADKYALLKGYKVITGEDPDQFKSDDNNTFSKTVALATDEQKNMLKKLCKDYGIDIKSLLAEVGCTGKMTQEQYGKALRIINGAE